MTTNAGHRPWSDLAIPPGELLEEELSARGMAQHDLAVRMGRPAQAINEIVRGKKRITDDTALGLEKVLGIPAHLWVSLEASYQLTKAQQREIADLESQEQWLKEFPVHDMERLGWIRVMQSPSEVVREVLSFFGVASFDAWRTTVAGFRITPGTKVSAGALAAWMRRGELAGLDMATRPYRADLFREALAAIRSLTVEPVDVFVPRMRELCAEAGVALAFVPELPDSAACGCARWLAKDKALIALSLRYKTNDHLWFSFFHEAAHVLKH